MRWRQLDTWQGMIAAATMLHDGIYPSSSPTPAGKACGCSDPTSECVKLAVAAEVPSGWVCTVPSYLPSLFISGAMRHETCPSLIPDWKPMSTAQGGSKESKSPGIPESTTADILAWVRSSLDYLQANNGHPGVRIAAGMLLSDLDVSVSIETLERLGEAMLDRFHYEKPWKPLDKRKPEPHNGSRHSDPRVVTHR